jgi:AbrB family looped-hinge helix DNA binding protein
VPKLPRVISLLKERMEGQREEYLSLHNGYKTNDESALLLGRLPYFCSMTTTISSRGQTVIPAEIRARHHLTEQSRLAWIDDGQTIRVVPLAAGANKYGRGIAKDLDLARALRADRAEERRRERSRRRS